MPNLFRKPMYMYSILDSQMSRCLVMWKIRFLWYICLISVDTKKIVFNWKLVGKQINLTSSYCSLLYAYLLIIKKCRKVLVLVLCKRHFLRFKNDMLFNFMIILKHFNECKILSGWSILWNVTVYDNIFFNLLKF